MFSSRSGLFFLGGRSVIRGVLSRYGSWSILFNSSRRFLSVLVPIIFSLFFPWLFGFCLALRGAGVSVISCSVVVVMIGSALPISLFSSTSISGAPEISSQDRWDFYGFFFGFLTRIGLAWPMFLYSSDRIQVFWKAILGVKLGNAESLLKGIYYRRSLLMLSFNKSLPSIFDADLLVVVPTFQGAWLC